MTSKILNKKNCFLTGATGTSIPITLKPALARTDTKGNHGIINAIRRIKIKFY